MTKVLFPAGRLVQGSIYKPNTHDLDKRPLTDHNGNPRVEYYFAVAIPKKGEASFLDTDWGAQLKQIADEGFRNNETARPDFAWKIVDGDSPHPDMSGKAPNTKEGHPGNWVVRFANGFPIQVLDSVGAKQITEQDFVLPGDWIETFAAIRPNSDTKKPGIYINPEAVAFQARGERIDYSRDYTNVGFGQASLPNGVDRNAAPQGGGFNPADTTQLQQPPAQQPPAQQPPAQQPPAQQPPAQQPVQPDPTFLQPPAAAPVAPPAAPAPKTMTAKAGGIGYEQFIAQGWTDEQLIQHGYMEA